MQLEAERHNWQETEPFAMAYATKLTPNAAIMPRMDPQLQDQHDRQIRVDGLFHPVQTLKTFEAAVSQIADAVRAGDLRLGDRLPSERALAALMSISRPTMREAIAVLTEAGVLEVRVGPGRGTFVSSEIIPSILLEERSEFRIDQVTDVLEARRLIEPRVAQLSALYARDEDFEAMRRAIEAMRASGADRAHFVQMDLRFHIAMARSTQNDTLVATMQMILKRIAIAWDMMQRTPGDAAEAIDLHERTLRAIMAGHYEEIEAVMDAHLVFTERVWEEETGRARIRRPPAFLVSGVPLTVPTAVRSVD